MIKGMNWKFNFTIYSKIKGWHNWIYQITLHYLILVTCDLVVKINTRDSFSSLS